MPTVWLVQYWLIKVGGSAPYLPFRPKDNVGCRVTVHWTAQALLALWEGIGIAAGASFTLQQPDERCAFREPRCDLEAITVTGVGPVHMLPSTCLQKVDEQPEDADNQRNVTRMGSQPSDPSTTVHVPVTLTGPPGETTVAPSEYLPVTDGRPSHPSLCCSRSVAGEPSLLL